MDDWAVQRNLITFNALMSACENASQWQWVLELLLQMSTSVVVRPDVLSYNAVISSCEKGLQWQWALHCYTSMMLASIRPSIITYNSLLTAFDKSDAPWPLALNLFSAASSAHVAPDALTFHAAVLAVIFDCYGKIRSGITDKDTLWTTIQRQAMALRYTSSWYATVDLLTGIKNAKSDNLTPEGFREIFRGITDEQVEQIYELAEIRAKNDTIKGQPTLLGEAIASILLGIDDVRDGVRTIQETRGVVGWSPPALGRRSV
eukprot:g9237.t1